jgi:hypothetical protein
MKARILVMAGEERAAEELIRQSAATFVLVKERRMLAEAKVLLAITVMGRDSDAAAEYLGQAIESLRNDIEAPELYDALTIAACLFVQRGMKIEAAAASACADHFYRNTGTDPDPLVRSKRQAPEVEPGSQPSVSNVIEIALVGLPARD